MDRNLGAGGIEYPLDDACIGTNGPEGFDGGLVVWTFLLLNSMMTKKLIILENNMT